MATTLVVPFQFPPSGYASAPKVQADFDALVRYIQTLAPGTTNSGLTNQLAYYPSDGTTIGGLSLITASQALVSDSNGLPIASTTTSTELGYVSGVTSSIQTQLGTKATDSLVVHLAGSETVTGGKTFTAFTGFGNTTADAPIKVFLDGTNGRFSSWNWRNSTFSKAPFAVYTNEDAPTFSMGSCLAFYQNTGGVSTDIQHGILAFSQQSTGTDQTKARFELYLRAGSAGTDNSVPVITTVGLGTAGYTYTLFGPTDYTPGSTVHVESNSGDVDSGVRIERRNATTGRYNLYIDSSGNFRIREVDTTTNLFIMAKTSGNIQIPGTLSSLATSNQLVLGTTRTATITAPTPGTSSRTYTFPDLSGDYSVVGTIGSQTIAGAKTFSSAVSVTTGTNQLILGSGNTTTISASAPASSAVYTIVDVGTSANFILDKGNFTFGGVETFSNAVTITPTTNQLILGTTRTVTISATQPAGSSRTWTIPDISGAGTFAALEGTQTFSGSKTFSSALTINPASNQIVLGSTNTVTISAPAPASSRIYTLPDAGTNANIVMDQGNFTFAGSETFSAAVTITPTTNQLVLGTTRTITLNAAQPATSSRVITFPDPGAAANVIYDVSSQTLSGAKTFSTTLTAQALIDISGASAGQLKFPSSQNASSDAHTLDDYAEGTWNPTLTGWTNTGSPTVTGTYTKVGRLVFVTVRIAPATNISATTGTSHIDGLPFTPAVSAGATACNESNGGGYSCGAILTNGSIYPTTTGVLTSVFIMSGCYSI